MRKTLINKYISEPRFNRYLRSMNNDESKARKLYNSNVRLAQTFHPIITQFEVIFRNSINECLNIHFSDSNWIINQKSQFMSDSSLGRSNFFLKNSILKTEQKLRMKRIEITSGKLIAEQSFGFWISFFLPHHYALIDGVPIRAFLNKPNNINRANINSRLITIRDFRNRISHCEPICFNGNTVDFTDALQNRDYILELIEWIEPNLSPFIKKLDNTRNKIESIRRLFT